VTATITVGKRPYGVAVNPGTNTAYVANDYDGTVSVIRSRTNTVTATITVGNGPFGVAVNGRTNTAYVANSVDNTVSVISEP
jgi:YVTN family beta-propeller protein